MKHINNYQMTLRITDEKTIEIRIMFDPSQTDYSDTIFKFDSALAELKAKYPETRAHLYTNAI